MASLGQNENGTWNVTLRHSGPSDIAIPMRIRHDNVEYECEVRSEPLVIETDWTTPIGEAINTANTEDGILWTAEDVKTGSDRYHVKELRWTEVKPYHPEPVIEYVYKFLIQPDNVTMASNTGTYTFDAILQTFMVEEGTEIFIRQENVAASTSWSVDNTGCTMDGNNLTYNNTGTTGNLNVQVNASYTNEEIQPGVPFEASAQVTIPPVGIEYYIRVVGDTALTINQTGGNFSVVFETNVPTSDFDINWPDWVTFSTFVVDTTRVTLNLTATENESDTRSGAIVFSRTGGTPSATVNLSQSSYVPADYTYQMKFGINDPIGHVSTQAKLSPAGGECEFFCAAWRENNGVFDKNIKPLSVQVTSPTGGGEQTYFQNYYKFSDGRQYYRVSSIPYPPSPGLNRDVTLVFKAQDLDFTDRFRMCNFTISYDQWIWASWTSSAETGGSHSSCTVTSGNQAKTAYLVAEIGQNLPFTWSVKSKPAWVTIQPNKGRIEDESYKGTNHIKKGMEVTVEIGENTTGKERTGTIVFKHDTADSQIISEARLEIIQEANT